MRKRFNKLILILLVFLMLFTACNKNNNQTVEETQEEVAKTEDVQQEEKEPEKEPEDEKPEETESEFMEVKYSDAFSVEYLEDGVKLVTDAEDRKLLLVPKGDTPPEGYDDAILIETPVENAYFCSTTQVGMLRPLGDDIWDHVGAVNDDSDGWPFPEVLEGLEDGSIAYLGTYEPDYEMLQDFNPDLTFVYTGSYPQTEIIKMLEELDLPYAVDNEYMENHHTGRLEWIKFLATFFNKDEEAIDYVNSEIEKLEKMEDIVKDAPKPKVAWGAVIDGTVYVPGVDSYVAEAIRAAGGDYVFSNIEGTGSSQITLEEFFVQLEDADYWIYSSNSMYMPDKKTLLESAPVLADTKVVQEGNIYQFGLDYYYETDKAGEQVIDIAAIIHPDLFPDYEINHFNKLAE